MRVAALGALALCTVGGGVGAASAGGADQPTPIVRGAHVSGAVRYQPQLSAAVVTTAAVQCTTPAGGNYRTDCNSTGRPVNETWIASNGSTYVAGANDYNSYNGQGQDGFYTSADGKTWSDGGPVDVFPHNPNNGAGDPGLAIDTNKVVYYSSLLFNFHSCNVGGVELMRRDPTSGAWSYYQIAANSSAQFQDKPAIALDQAHSQVFVSWTQFGSCTGVNVTSPIEVALFATGATSSAPSSVLPVPGSTYSQGSSIVADGSGGFWVAWEEYPSSSASTGEIRLAHWTGSSWASLSGSNQWETISPGTFTDLPSPLPGFSFRDNSFPAVALVGGNPKVVWTSYDTGVGRAYEWPDSPSTPLSNSGGNQFFPSIAADGAGGYYVSYSQVNAGTSTYDQQLVHGTSITRISTVSSSPNQDAFFSGQFIGDYNGMTLGGSGVRPIWTDIRGPDPNYPGDEMDSMVSDGTAVTTPVDFSISASPAQRRIHPGDNTTYTVTVMPSSSFIGSVALSDTGVPPNANASFSPSTTTSTSTLTVNTSTSTPTGRYTITITGSGDGVTHSTTVTLQIR